MHKAFPLPGESSHWQYKFPLPVEGVPTARRMEIPLPGLSLDEEIAQKLYAEELAKDTARKEHEKFNLEKALELQKQLDERKDDKGDQAHDIGWSDPSVLRYHALQNRPFSKAKVDTPYSRVGYAVSGFQKE
nr:hypothetical protein [Tanacetum cinerariifolium]